MNINILRDKFFQVKKLKYDSYEKIDEKRAKLSEIDKNVNPTEFETALSDFKLAHWSIGYYSGMADILENLIVNYRD